MCFCGFPVMGWESLAKSVVNGLDIIKEEKGNLIRTGQGNVTIQWGSSLLEGTVIVYNGRTYTDLCDSGGKIYGLHESQETGGQLPITRQELEQAHKRNAQHSLEKSFRRYENPQFT